MSLIKTNTLDTVDSTIIHRIVIFNRCKNLGRSQESCSAIASGSVIGMLYYSLQAVITTSTTSASCQHQPA
jgi:hypothetical protein